jgi:hypothetical protein
VFERGIHEITKEAGYNRKRVLHKLIENHAIFICPQNRFVVPYEDTEQLLGLDVIADV